MVSAINGELKPDGLDSCLKLDSTDFFRAHLLPKIVQCSESDCDQDTRLAIETRDSEALPYCNQHAHVVWADWMVGV